MPRRRRPLQWYDTELGPTPGCMTCAELLFTPLFAEAVHSVGIERSGDPADLAKRTVDAYHAGGHTDPP